MVDAVLCELEGVLIDTIAARREALRRALADDGIEMPDDARAVIAAAPPTVDVVRAAMGARGAAAEEPSLELARLRAERHFAELVLRGAALAPGARELLEGAAACGARIAVVTGAGRRVAESLLALAGLEALVSCIVAAEDGAAAKPSPAPYRRALERLRRTRSVDLARAIAIESSADGVRAARAAGLRAMLVGAPPLAAVAPDVTVGSLAGLSPDDLDVFAAPEEVVG